MTTLPIEVTSRTHSQSAGLTSFHLLACLMLGLALLFSIRATAQTGGQGAIQGTVQDSLGAVVPNATISARNVNTGVVTARPSTDAGFYSITPLIPGTYTVTVSAKGFQNFEQQNLVIDAMHTTGLDVKLKVGESSETVTVTDMPPALETTNATLGGTIENNVYTALPVMISGLQQRDITQFSNLLPGAQQPPGGRSSIIGGTAQRLGELYVDGLPLTTASQQGDNRPVFNIVPLEAIDQVQVVTSGFSAEYQGAGLENYSTKSGGNQYHGSVFEYIRNTAFDAWSFSTKPCATTTGCPNTAKKVVNGVVTTVFGPKPAEHQNEYGATIGGPISIPGLFSGHDKLFFFLTYDRFVSSQAANPSSSTVPTTLMRKGDFRELIPADTTTGGLGNTAGVTYKIYDPTTQAACTAFYGTPCRYQYGYTHGTSPTSDPVALGPGSPINVIPASQISPITTYMEQFLPAPTVDTQGTITNNYIGGLPQGYHNWIYSGRFDYNISEKQHLSLLITGGNRHAVPYTTTSTSNLPVPYLATTISTVAGHFAALEHSYTITPHIVNQFKYGFMNFGGPPVQNPTYGIAQYSATAAGITGLPAGQASGNFPIATFSGSNAPLSWASISGGSNSTSSTSVSETYTLVDNVQWVKGRHAMTFGIQYQWLEINSDSADTASSPVNIPWGTNSTANLSGTSWASGTGYSYASYILGAMGGSGSSASTSVTQQPFSVVGARYHPFAPYFQDDFKVTPKLTLNLGLRWDYLPTYTEALDRWSFLNPNITNPITGNLGALQFAGNYGGAGVSCGGCRTPVHNWYKNWGPRLGFAYSYSPKTVIRGGWAILYSHAGGTGGAGGAGVGTGQAGFNSTASFSDNVSGPAFYLNNNPLFSSPNANFGGPGYVLAPPAPISSISQTLNTGYYVCSGQTYAPCNGATGTFAGTGSSIAYPDPYYGGRAPEISFWNFGFQHELTKDITLTVNYVGTQSHFLAGASNIRGLQSGQLNPMYLGLGSNLSAKATTANIATAQTATGISIPVPYSGYTAAAALSTSPTIAHMLTWMPQYSSTTDTWGNVANANYNALQISLNKRFTNGLTFTVNYTYSKNIDDAGTARSGWAIPASATSNGRAWAQDRIDRSRSVNDLPELLNIFGVYQLPFGKGHIGGDHFVVRALASGWQLSEIFQYSSGLVLPLTATCSSTQNPGQGTCMPDYNPNFHGTPRIKGGWGKGVTAASLGTTKYLQGYISSAAGGAGTDNNTGVANQPTNPNPACSTSVGPFCNSNNYSIGNLARTAPYDLRGQSLYRLTMSVSRTFDITNRFKFVFRVDCQNVTNHTTFGNNAQNNQIQLNVNNAAFGTVNFASADSRAFQLSGRINF
ncbi:MAG: carboxypeptidase regulatory-like domain-containing protein [Acidobacteriaceae bacterium]|nr:carboxypeptidase regulatory-like domain-containing protein [Acidobacteriaceae bacterium]